MNKSKESNYSKKDNGITLVALVVTIIVLIILAGIGLNLVLGNNGVIKKANEASEETLKQTATEIMNLKITNIEIESYIERQELPTLQYLADKLCEDNEMEYVALESKKIATLDKINVSTGDGSIFTKLKEYPYEFEINSKLQLASINGVQIAENSDNEELENLQKKYDDFKLKIINALNEKNSNLGEDATDDEIIDAINSNVNAEKITISEIAQMISVRYGGNHTISLDDISSYNTITIESRTRSAVAGTTYWIIDGVYTNEDGEEVEENILKTTEVSTGKETYDISKYDKLNFRISCEVVGGGTSSTWRYYYFNGIEIF